MNKTKIPHFAYNVPRVERRASAKQCIFCKIKSGTAHKQCRSLQRPEPFNLGLLSA
nr:MAG TPA: hypothetical protein [Caudoviricetes sp.]